jgi:hypothetical protein
MIGRAIAFGIRIMHGSPQGETVNREHAKPPAESAIGVTAN